MKIGKLKKVGISLLTVFMLGTLLTANMTTTEAADEQSIETQNNIKINLFDYNTGNSEKVWGGNNPSRTYNQGINYNTAFKFLNDDSGESNRLWNKWTGKYTDNNNTGGEPRYGIVDDELNNEGYPQFTMRSNNQSLKYLFDPNEDVNGKTSYTDVTGLLSKDENGSFTFDSDKQYAEFNKSTNTFNVNDAIDWFYVGKSRVDKNLGVFYPFNSKVEIMENAQSGNSNVEAYSYGYGYSADATTKTSWDDKDYEIINHYFGMTMEADFLQPKEGRINNQDMIFEFSGDDDVWVFIDDKLVLDLGGIHDKVTGTINFASGDVIIKNAAGNTVKSYNMYNGNGSLFDKNTDFANYTSHKIKFYYLERGNNASNCKLDFNLATIPQGSVSITKEVIDENNSSVNYSNVDFEFQLEKKNSSGTWDNVANQRYEIYDNAQPTGEYGTTDANGKFYLQHEQTAVFTNVFKATDYYRVTETGAYLEGYNIMPSVGTTHEVIENNEKIGVQTDELNVDNYPAVTFYNRITETSQLNITKEIATGSQNLLNGQTFKFTLKINDELYDGTYLKNDDSFETSNGKINITKDDKISISGLPYGSSFEIVETENEAYLPTYSVSGDVYNENTTEKAYGKVNGSIANVTITNQINENRKTNVTVNKEWIDGNYKNRPSSINVQLYKNNNALSDKIISLSSGNWTGTFNDLPYYDKGTDGQYFINEYSVKEVNTPDNYVSEVKKDSDNNYSFTITNTLKTSLTITKTIDKINTEDGDAIFTFKVINKNNPTDYFYKTLRLSKAGSEGTQSITISDLKYGDEYIIEELDTIRYTPSNSEFNDTENEDYAKKEITLESITNTVNFYNKLTYENNFSHTDVVTNEFSVDENGVIKITPNTYKQLNEEAE